MCGFDQAFNSFYHVAIRLLVSPTDYLFILLLFVCLLFVVCFGLAIHFAHSTMLPDKYRRRCIGSISFRPRQFEYWLFISYMTWFFYDGTLKIHLSDIRSIWSHRHLDGFLSIWFVFVYHFNHLQHSTSSSMSGWLTLRIKQQTDEQMKKVRGKNTRAKQTRCFFLSSSLIHFKIFMVMIFWIDKKSQKLTTTFRSFCPQCFDQKAVKNILTEKIQ